MKRSLLTTIVILYFLNGWAQIPDHFYHAFQVKIDPLEIGYSFPRLGIGFEQKFTKHSLWSSFHYGWDGLSTKHLNRYFDGEFNYWGIKAGLKRIYPSGIGEYFIGAQLGYDKTSANIIDDVFYDLDRNTAVLYDQAKYQRSRVGLLLENGYEFFIGNRFSIEFSAGLGIRRIEKWYKNVENPFVLNEVEPRVFRNKTQHKYVDTVWKPAFIGSVKFGYRW